MSGCFYRSDRGALFVTAIVPSTDAADRRGLLDGARLSCSTKPHEIPRGAIPSFSCVEDKDSGRSVVGNTIFRGRAWMIVVLLTDPRDDGAAQQRAVDALLRVIPPSATTT